MLALVLILCTCVTLSGACTCLPGYGPERFCRYDVVVRGMAIAEYLEREDPYDPRDPFSDYYADNDMVYTINVTQAIKVPDTMTCIEVISMRSHVQSSMCGTRLALDVDAVFFGFLNHKGEIQTGLCDPNVAWESLTEDDQDFLTKQLVGLCAHKPPSLIRPPGIRPPWPRWTTPRGPSPPGTTATREPIPPGTTTRAPSPPGTTTARVPSPPGTTAIRAPSTPGLRP